MCTDTRAKACFPPTGAVPLDPSQPPVERGGRRLARCGLHLSIGSSGRPRVNSVNSTLPYAWRRPSSRSRRKRAPLSRKLDRGNRLLIYDPTTRSAARTWERVDQTCDFLGPARQLAPSPRRMSPPHVPVVQSCLEYSHTVWCYRNSYLSLIAKSYTSTHTTALTLQL